jgi:hypothetical protein
MIVLYFIIFYNKNKMSVPHMGCSILNIQKTLLVAVYLTACLTPGTALATTTAMTMKAVNYTLLGHYGIFAFRVAFRARKFLPCRKRCV